MAICTAGRPVVLFLDDLQWIDKTLLDLVIDLVTIESLKHLLFIGSYRSSEVCDGHALPKLCPNASSVKPIEKIHLEGLSKEVTEEFAADSLCLDFEAFPYLAGVAYSKTQGNISFIRQTLETVLRKKAIINSMATFRRTWDEIRVSAVAEMSDHVLDLLTAKIATLPRLV